MGGGERDEKERYGSGGGRKMVGRRGEGGR